MDIPMQPRPREETGVSPIFRCGKAGAILSQDGCLMLVGDC